MNAVAKIRHAISGEATDTLAAIYQEETNLAIWQRTLTSPLRASVTTFLAEHPNFQSATTLSPESAPRRLSRILGLPESSPLCEDIAELVDMFCCLFELDAVGLRLTALNKAMCPKFHVDRVPCRLVTTYQGLATEWLPHALVDRSRLGPGPVNAGQVEDRSCELLAPCDVQRLNSGDVALLKGELWEGNEGAGLVHRSPALAQGEYRLLLTLDFAS